MSACSSPTDVPANRTWRYETDPEAGKKKLELNPPMIDFDYVYSYGIKSVPLTITNITDRTREIRSVSFKNYSSLFSVDESQFPITLAPAGNNGSSKEITITFTAQQFGIFDEEMTFEGIDNPVLSLKSKVPMVYCPDNNNFGEKIIDSTFEPKELWIRNDGQTSVVIKSARIENYDSVFKIESSFPITIEKESAKSFFVRFIPKEEKFYSDKIIFQIEAGGIYDSTTVVTGSGIR